ncbi:hypothetical protein [Sphaerisporangium corydalis]|uniref:DUF5134 domain-containing protein n=1 Tax=Sphaerisporangium corydalis TaxID=1441875 RepID=A0ABV9ERG2_9ACTN|nr:hypothetical protein [Sphaerisporangium corydalis]
MPLLHMVGVSVGCALALVPVLLPSARPARRWPHVVMALGMAAGHLGGWFLLAGLLALPAAGWLCGSPSRRADSAHHIQDFVGMSILLVLTASGGPPLGGSPLGGAPAGHAHASGSPATLALAIGMVWTCARLVRLLPERYAKRRAIGQDLCAAGMAAIMTFMAALPS